MSGLSLEEKVVSGLTPDEALRMNLVKHVYQVNSKIHINEILRDANKLVNYVKSGLGETRNG
jgi:hypothetical protein